MATNRVLRRLVLHGTVVGSLLLAIAGCGDKAVTTATTQLPSATTRSVASVPAATAVGTVPNATSGATSPGTVGSTARAGQVIKVGYMNNEGDTLSFPAFRLGGEAAVDHINGAGGIDGAKIQIVSCIDDGSPEGSTNCANKFVDEHVTFAFAGIDFGSDSALPILSGAGIPLITEVAWGTAQKNDPMAFQMHAALDAIYASPLNTLAKLGSKNIGALLIDTASNRSSVDGVVTPVSKKLGVGVKVTYVPSANVDWSSSVSAAIANGAQALWAQVGDADCIKFVQAARALKFEGPIFAGNCSDFVSQLGQAAVGVYTTTGVYLPEMREALPSGVQAQVDVYVAAMKASGHANDINNGFFVEPFSAWMELATLIHGIDGPITGAGMVKALNSTTIPGFMGPDVKCGQHVWPTQSSACSAANLVTQVAVGPDGSNFRKPAVEGFVDLSSLVS